MPTEGNQNSEVTNQTSEFRSSRGGALLLRIVLQETGESGRGLEEKLQVGRVYLDKDK